jgi:hypothetical protein
LSLVVIVILLMHYNLGVRGCERRRVSSVYGPSCTTLHF